MPVGPECGTEAFDPAGGLRQAAFQMSIGCALEFEGIDLLPMGGEFGGERLAALRRLPQPGIGDTAFLLGSLQPFRRRQEFRIQLARLVEHRRRGIPLAANLDELGPRLGGLPRGVFVGDPGLVLTPERDIVVPDAFVPLAQRFLLGAMERLRRLEHFCRPL